MMRDLMLGIAIFTAIFSLAFNFQTGEIGIETLVFLVSGGYVQYRWASSY